MKTKTLLTVILAALAIVSASAQNRIVKQNLQVASFSAISASSGWDVIIRQGDRQSVSIEISEELLDRAVVEVKNGTLHIYNESNNRSSSIRNMRNITQKAYVTVTDLQKIAASGGVDIRFETPVKAGDFEVALSGGTDLENLTLDCKRFNGQFSGGCDADIRFTSVHSVQSVKADVSGGSDVELRDISAQTTRISASGGCDIKLTGKTVDFTLNASGGCDISASDFIARNCNAGFSGAADGSIHVTDRLDITVSGSADVTCFGNPQEVSKRVHKSSSLKFR